MSKVCVVGNGGHAKVVVETLFAAGLTPIGFLDDQLGTPSSVPGIPVLGVISEEHFLESGADFAILAIGSNQARRAIDDQLAGVRFLGSLVFPNVVRSTDVEILDGTVVCAGVVLQPSIFIGRHCIINTSSSVDHDCHIGDFVHIAPGARITGGVSIGDNTLVGAGAIVLPGVSIGDNVVVGAGAVVAKSVPSNSTVVGVPARPVEFPESRGHPSVNE